MAHRDDQVLHPGGYTMSINKPFDPFFKFVLIALAVIAAALVTGTIVDFVMN